MGLVLGVDSFLVPVLRGSSDVAAQLLLLDSESFAISSAVTFVLYDSIGRARPVYADCQLNKAGPGCDTAPTSSFPSGHTAEAFTFAGASCANHAYLPIYGRGYLDALACARDVTIASADAFLRLIGDRHYLTDTIAGAAIGFAFGYTLPTLLHYRAPKQQQSSLKWTLTPLSGRDQYGVAIAGSF